MEQIDSRDRRDDTIREERLRQINRETGEFLAIVTATAPDGVIVEIGTSAGYSTMWLALAAKMMNRKIITHELLTEKIVMAEKTISDTNLTNIVTLNKGNVLDYLPKIDNIGFCFLDVEKELYLDCFKIVSQNLISGGLLVADNVISHSDELLQFITQVKGDNRFDSSIVPIGKGLLIARKV